MQNVSPILTLCQEYSICSEEGRQYIAGVCMKLGTAKLSVEEIIFQPKIIINYGPKSTIGWIATKTRM